MQLPDPPISRVAEACRRFAETSFDERVDQVEMEARVSELLLGRKAIWLVMADRLITRDEAIAVLAQNVHSWLMDRTRREWGDENPVRDWTPFVTELEEAMFGSAPRVL
jgi:hypothetical protein